MALHFENISKVFNGKAVLQNISGQIDRGEKIGLIGVNGVGKTTLVKILAGLEKSDQGSIRCTNAALRILYLEQYPAFTAGLSVYDELLKTLQAAESGQEFRLDANSAMAKALNSAVEKALNTVGLGKEVWTQPAQDLSGGEKTKLMLCRVLVSDYDLLILDEPTNHLDLESSQWLEDYLSKLNKTLVVISHDRFFLDVVANKIWELTPKGLQGYVGNYSAYKVQKENEIKNLTKEYSKQQSKIQSLENMIAQRHNWYARAHKAAGQNDFYRAKAKKHAGVLKAKERELERLKSNQMDKPEKGLSPAFEIINKNIELKKLPPVLVRIENLTKAFGSKEILRDVSLQIRREDKIALLGANGTGKTTLLQIIIGLDREYEGSLAINPQVRIGYFAQELSTLNYNATILEDVLNVGVKVNEARLLLASLLFKGDEVYKSISRLSMGERCRVAFAKLILAGANLLVLDEPTNYMDIISKEKIEEVLEEFQGSVIFVSHDRYFTQRIANKIYLIKNKAVQCYEGNYAYYLTKSQEERGAAAQDDDSPIIRDKISRLEVELALLSSKLAEPLDEEARAFLNAEFLRVAREINNYKEALQKLQLRNC